MTLYDIDERILELIDPETGEVANAEEFDRLQMERTAKLEAVALAYKNYAAEAAALAEQEKAFGERKRKATAKADYYKMLLDRGTAGEKFSTPLVEISYRKSTEVVVDDLSAVPFIYTTHEIKPDKVAIKDALKRGETILGARLAEKLNIQIK
jgi:hypothetical protein